jgi:hypothetical protein
MSLEYFPNKLIHFESLSDGHLEQYGIEAEVNGVIGTLAAPDHGVAVIRRAEDGWAQFITKIPASIQAAIARSFDVDIPFIPPGTHVVLRAPILDIEFSIGWLTAGRECDRLKETGTNTEFRKIISRAEAEVGLEFAKAANAFLRKAYRQGAFFLDIKSSSWNDMFMIMASIGFFRRVDMYYQMVTPRQITVDTISEALGLLLETKDDVGVLHPERHLVTMTHHSAKYHRKRLRKCKASGSLAAEQKAAPAEAPEMSHG